MVLKNEIRNLIDEVMLNAKSYNNDDSLFDFGILDSLATIRLILLIERKLEITINQNDLLMENFESVDCLHAYLNNIKEEIVS